MHPLVPVAFRSFYLAMIALSLCEKREATDSKCKPGMSPKSTLSGKIKHPMCQPA